jgi:hypothetical protein
MAEGVMDLSRTLGLLEEGGCLDPFNAPPFSRPSTAWEACAAADYVSRPVIGPRQASTRPRMAGILLTHRRPTHPFQLR